MDGVHQEAPGVLRIDHRWQGVPGLIASYLLAGDDGQDDLALVEAGPASTAHTLLAGIRAAGQDPAEVTRILLTHIHLDHAAAAGVLLREMPRARVYVHPRGAAHLADPSRLISSATRIYGAEMDRLWGRMLPVPADRIVTLDDGAEVRAGGRTLRALQTPGHAEHHVAYHDPAAALVFTGDVGGVRLPGSSYVRPPTPPPEFDLGRWLQSVGTLRSVRPEHLLLTHFGAFADAGRHLDELAARLRDWTAWARAAVADGADAAALAEGIRRRGDAEILAATGDPAIVGDYEKAVAYDMIASGLHRYLTRPPKHP
ncbi:MAG TPA: MBL fold metallo-hydrolase [Longimicrobiaceae bacterium]|jgi:glyoxylase-like metal-dependent hydrolase (beta-lactamase superfamily II)|nr:MBL fold metallo-hydrolase [Longimicrobiaceae bacterium]